VNKIEVLENLTTFSEQLQSTVFLLQPKQISSSSSGLDRRMDCNLNVVLGSR
jgi:hypothetical protein